MFVYFHCSSSEWHFLGHLMCLVSPEQFIWNIKVYYVSHIVINDETLKEQMFPIIPFLSWARRKTWCDILSLFCFSHDTSPTIIAWTTIDKISFTYSTAYKLKKLFDGKINIILCSTWIAHTAFTSILKDYQNELIYHKIYICIWFDGNFCRIFFLRKFTLPFLYCCSNKSYELFELFCLNLFYHCRSYLYSARDCC